MVMYSSDTQTCPFLVSLGYFYSGIFQRQYLHEQFWRMKTQISVLLSLDHFNQDWHDPMLCQ